MTVAVVGKTEGKKSLDKNLYTYLKLFLLLKDFQENLLAVYGKFSRKTSLF